MNDEFQNEGIKKGKTIAEKVKLFEQGVKTNNSRKPQDMEKLNQDRIKPFEPKENQQDTVLNKNEPRQKKKISNPMKILNKKEGKEKDVKKEEEKKDEKEVEVKKEEKQVEEVKVEENQDKKEVEVKEEEVKVAEKKVEEVEVKKEEKKVEEVKVEEAKKVE